MEEKIYSIKFLGIETISKSLSIPPKELSDQLEFNFNFIVDVKVSPEHKGAISVTDISISDKVSKHQYASFKTACIFEFPDFENIFIKKEEQRYEIPIDLEIVLKSTGLSTTRGIIHSELRGTYLHTAVLPLIDMAALIRDQHNGK